MPGLAKTLLVRSIADSLDLTFRRIQFTPDLMPADNIGTTIVIESDDEHGRRHREFRFHPGPIFSHVVLADEINRATAKAQSALLEAMEEHQLTLDGHTHALPAPFFVTATQNPLHQAGTFPLPAPQLARFLFKAVIPSPTEAQLLDIARRTTAEEPPALEPVIGEADLAAFRGFVRHLLIRNREGS